MAIPLPYYLTVSLKDLVITGSPYYTDDTLTGSVTATHYHEYPEAVYTRSYITVKLINQSGQTVKTTHVLDQFYFQLAPEVYHDDNVPWSIDTGNVPTGQYKVRIEKYGDSSIFVESAFITLQRQPSSLNYVEICYYTEANNAPYWDPNAPNVFYAVINQDTYQIFLPYPTGMDRTNLMVRFAISQYATLQGGTQAGDWYIQGDFQNTINSITVIAEDLTERNYSLIFYAITPAYLFAYDNIYTKAVPGERERGETVTWDCLVSNSGSTVSPANETLTIKLESEDQTYSQTVDTDTLPALDPYEDHECSGSFTVPNDVPLGSDIPYYVVFYLNASVVRREIVISNWDVGSKGIVYNKFDAAFVRETSLKSKHFTSINNDFYVLALEDDASDFWLSTDRLEDGNVTMFGQGFNPSVTFYVNAGGFEKIFDDMILHIGSVGVDKIEYWTEDQYAIHEWPDTPDSNILLKPWIDPEFREDKYYFPIHNEELADYNFVVDGVHTDETVISVVNTIPDTMRDTGYLYLEDRTGLAYSGFDSAAGTFTLEEARTFADQDALYGIPGDNANTRELVGTWMKVKITFRALYNFFLKTAVTDFTESKI